VALQHLNVTFSVCCYKLQEIESLKLGIACSDKRFIQNLIKISQRIVKVK
jgi:hypothetical protein